MNAERWAPIPSAPGYEASDAGRVRSVSRVIPYRRYGRVCYRALAGRDLVPIRNPKGYDAVCVGRGKRLIHALVLEAFVGPRPPDMECCHNNGVKTDNRLENLRWDTRSANAQDALRHGHNVFRQRTHCPRGHELREPNLVAAERPNRRACLACSRARAYRRHWGAAAPSYKQVSDRYYSAIMRAEAVPA